MSASLTEPPGAAIAPPRRIAEAALVVALVALLLWTESRHVLDKPARQAIGAVVAAAVVAVMLLRRPTLAQCGLRPPSWTAGLGTLAGFTLVSSLSLLVVGRLRGELGATAGFADWLADTWPVEGVQQVLLHVVLMPAAVALRGRADAVAVAAAAAVFGLLHAPNWPLVALTAFAGAAWVAWFRRHRNLPAVWLSHILLGSAAMYALGQTLCRLRVGAGYVYFGG